MMIDDNSYEHFNIGVFRCCVCEDGDFEGVLRVQCGFPNEGHQLLTFTTMPGLFSDIKKHTALMILAFLQDQKEQIMGDYEITQEYLDELWAS